MNSIVALPIAAALPVAAPAMPTVQVEDTAATGAAALARTEQIVDLLRTCYVREGWKIDEAGAERALEYMRQYANDGSDPDDGRAALIDFISSHGQSLDWVFDGDVRGLICGRAETSRRAAVADAKLLALADNYVEAEKRWSELCLIVDRMEGAAMNKGRLRPEALHLRSSDYELGLPTMFGGDKQHHAIGFAAVASIMWDRKVDVDQLREERWQITSKSVTDDELTVRVRNVTPSKAARSRANEIIAAFDGWTRAAKKLPRGHRKAERERDMAADAVMDLEEQVAATPATTMEGLLAKARCAQAHCKELELDHDEPLAGFALSILKDIVRNSAPGA